jgi:hypothetical protein
MGFLKNLLGGRNSKEESFVPAPTQTISGLAPIVVHAVERLYPSIEEQKHAFTFLLQHTKEKDVLDQLSLIRMGIRNLEKIMKENPSLTIRYAIFSESGFTNMKAATKWVKSITNSPQSG